MSETTDRPLGQRLKHGVESKILIPIATAIVGAAASYLIKKLPMILEEKVLPKLLERDAPEPVVHAVEQTVSTLDGDPGAPTGGEPDDRAQQEASKSPAAGAKAAKAEPEMSNDEREEQRREREKRRRERKRAATKAA